MKDIKFKIIIFLISSCFSLLAAEFFLRKVIIDVNLPRVYHDVAEFNLYNKEEDGKVEYFRDRSYEVYQANHNTEILCLGDSFTNGGNTFWDNTYPYKLFLKYNKQVTVRNLGVCSSTTLAISKRLQQFFEGPEYNSKKKYIISIMAGSADIFSHNLEVISDIDVSKYQKWHNMDSELGKIEARFEKIYFLRALKVLILEIYNKLVTVKNSLQSSSSFNQAINKCEVSRLEKFICLSELINNSENFSDLSLDLKEHLVMRYLFGNMIIKSSEISNVLMSFIEIIKVHPRYLEKDFLVMDLIGLVNLQDKITLSDLNQFILNYSKGINPKSLIVNKRLVENSNQSLTDLKKLNSIRNIEWAKIHAITKKYNAKLVVMNYPIAYKSTNDYLAEMAKKNELDFLDTEKIFTEKNSVQEPLLDDWEHCSPKGYDLIAELLFNRLESLK